MMYQELHSWANSIERFYFSRIEAVSEVKNGIYLCFELGEKMQGLDRIVRVGSHPSNGRFYKRIIDHFLKKHRSSIMRKHIGRCFLHQNGDNYLKVWDYSNSQVKKGSPLRNELKEDKEKMIEDKVSDHLESFSFVVIPELDNDSYRLELEAKLISTLNKEGLGCSDTWLGLSHPNEKIVKSGLWNIQHLDNELLLSGRDFDLIKERTK